MGGLEGPFSILQILSGRHCIIIGILVDMRTVHKRTRGVVGPYSTWPLPAVRDLTRDGRLSTYDVSVLKLSNVSLRGKCAQAWETP